MNKRIRFCKPGTIIIAAILLITLSVPTFAGNDGSTWGLELSGRINGTSFSMDDAESFMDHALDIKASEVKLKDDYFPAGTQMDFSLALRYTRFLLGFQYSLVSESEAGYEYGNYFGTTYYPAGTYKVRAESRDFHVLFGYIQPIYKKIDFVAIFMYGSASVEAHILEEEGYSSSSWDLNKDFGSMRMEGRIRVNLRENMAIDFLGGYRIADAGNMSGDYKIGNSAPLNAEYTNYPFDLSGLYYGVGITLKHLYE